MRVHADFSQRIIIRPQDREWVKSPSGGVERCMLDRIGGEVARATSLVRFAPGSSFPSHTHDGGEEYIVLEGTFSDNKGDFKKGSYVRNPIGTAHAPHTHQGCMIFVKLWQFDNDDQAHFDRQLSQNLEPVSVGYSTTILHETSDERVTFNRLEPQAALEQEGEGGLEILVLEGTVSANGDVLEAGTWLRSPPDMVASFQAGDEGASFWMKTGHLNVIKEPKAA